MSQDAPTTAHELRDWFRALKEASGLSFTEIAAAIEEEERNVKRWMTVDAEPVIPRGDVVLRLLSTLGVSFDPPAPGSVRGLNAQLGEMRALLATVDHLLEAARATEESGASVADVAAGIELDTRLRELEATVEAQGRATTTALKALTAGIRKLEPQRAAADPRATKKQASR